MRKITVLLLLSAILIIVSCKTVDISGEPELVQQTVRIEEEPAPVPQEPAPETEPEPAPRPEEEPEPAPVPEPSPQPEEEPVPIPLPETEPEIEEIPWTIGETGPSGGLVFESSGGFLELGIPLYEAASYDAAVEYCESISTSETGYRLPTMQELSDIYAQLFETEIAELDFTYYWSCENNPDGTVKVMNFDTGFGGSFFSDLDFVSALPVTQLTCQLPAGALD